MRTIVLKNMLNITSNDRIYCSLPLYHSSGSVISLSAWHCGGTIILRRNFSATVGRIESCIEL